MAKNHVFCAKHLNKARFSTVFSTGVEILGNKPKSCVAHTTQAPEALNWESATVAQQEAFHVSLFDTPSRARLVLKVPSRGMRATEAETAGSR